jgi:predicted phage terminase large subunit-like protein
VTFIAAKLSDNQILMRCNPQYLSNLKALPQVERERLLHGNWKIKPAAGLYFKRSQITLVDSIPDDVVRWVRAWDFAATEDKKKNNPEDGPAYTAGVLIGKRKCGRWIIADVVNQRLSAMQVKDAVYNTAVMDKAKHKHVRIRLSQDPGQAGKDQAEQYIKFLAGFSLSVVRETGSKETRAEPLSAQWEAGNVDVLIAPWNEEYFSQLESFPQGMFKDMVDASSNGFNEIESKKQQIPLDQSAGKASHESKWRA